MFKVKKKIHKNVINKNQEDDITKIQKKQKKILLKTDKKKKTLS